MKTVKAEHYLSVKNQLGEGPLWEAITQRLYWVDILSNQLNQYILQTGEVISYPFDQSVGFAVLRESGGFVLGLRDGIAFWTPEEDKMKWVAQPDVRQGVRFNDGKVDPAGRLWAGTIVEEEGTAALYLLDDDHNLSEMVSGVTISNGLGWSPDNKTMYYTDSMARTIWAYDFDLVTGAIRNRRDFLVDNVPGEVVPDGLCVDDQGFVWSARWGAGKVYRFDPKGNIERIVEVPVEFPTSCAFMGENLDQLVITSARNPVPEKNMYEQPLAGDLFILQTNVKGLPTTAYKG